MVEPDNHRFDTRALHAGQRPDPTTGSRAVPIHQTTSYVFDSVDHAAGLFNLEVSGHLYSRISNPTVAVLEERIASLEGGVGAVCTASGQAAFHLAMATILHAGDHVVASRNIYGGSHNILNLTMPRFGVTTSFVDPRDPAAFAEAIRPETRLVFAETLGNPSIEVLDIAAVAEVAHGAGLPLAVDSTFATPLGQNPIAHGVDLVVHSATKGIAGHNDATIGVVAGSEDLVAWLWGFAVLHGANASPADALNAHRGLRTLGVRLAHQTATAQRLAEQLEAHAGVETVCYPGLDSHPQRDLAVRQLRTPGGLLTFDLAGDAETGRRFVESVRLAHRATSLGGPETLVTHPASTTHVGLTPEEMEATGIGPGTIRVSCGLEHADDVVADLDQALAAAV